MEAGCGKRHRASRAMVIKISGDWHHELVTNHHTSSRKYESSSGDARTAICHLLSVMNIKQQNYEFNITKGKWFCRIMKRRRSIKTFFPYISFTICLVFPEDPASSFFFPDRTYPSSISSVKMLIKRLINHKCVWRYPMPSTSGSRKSKKRSVLWCHTLPAKVTANHYLALGWMWHLLWILSWVVQAVLLISDRCRSYQARQLHVCEGRGIIAIFSTRRNKNFVSSNA